MPLHRGLLISTHRNFEKQGSSEIYFALTKKLEINPSKVKTLKAGVSGLILAKIDGSEDLSIIMENLRKLEEEEPFFIYCLKIRPIQTVVEGTLQAIKDQIPKQVRDQKGSYKIHIGKRHTQYRSIEIIEVVAPQIPNKVNLSHPEWVLLIEILADHAGISVIPEIDIFSTKKAFEDSKEETNWFLD